MEGRETEVVQEDAEALQLLGEEAGYLQGEKNINEKCIQQKFSLFYIFRLPPHTCAYLVVLGVVIWEVDHVVEGLVEGQEGGLVEDQVVDLVEAQEAEAEALEPSFLQACQEASRTEEHLKITEDLFEKTMHSTHT